MDDDDAYYAGMRYSIGLRLTHPTLHPEVVADHLPWVAVTRWVAGQVCPELERNASRGVRADFGWESREERSGYRFFFRHLVEMLDQLEARKAWIAGYVGSGGTVTFVTRLLGERNIGDVLGPHDLMRLGKLGVGLRVEVVPVWP